MRLVAAMALGGCSLVAVHPPQIPAAQPDCSSVGLPILDGLVGATTGVLGGAMVGKHTADDDNAKNAVAGTLLLVATIAAVSAVYGFNRVHTCHQTLALIEDTPADARALATRMHDAAAAHHCDDAILLAVEIKRRAPSYFHLVADGDDDYRACFER